MKRLAWKAVAVIVAGMVTTACSGGGSEAPAAPGGGTSDTTPPVVSVAGSDNIELVYGSEYEDEGATATDNRDGTVPVTATGSVDPFTPGTYTITYTARDAAGNTGSATRTVSVSVPRYRLTVSAFGSASFTSGGMPLSCNTGGDICTLDVDAGESAQITSQVGPGWNFEYWLGCSSVEGNNCTIEMDRDRVVLFTASSQSPVELRPGVVELTAAQIAAIRNFDPDADTLFFAANTDLSGIGAGSIILADGRDNPDVAFARRVVDIISLSGAPTLMETINVPMDEVVRSGTIFVSPDEYAGTVPAAGPSGSAEARRAGDIVPISEVRPINELEVYNQDGLRVTLDGNVEVAVEPESALHYDDNGLVIARLAFRRIDRLDLRLNVAGSPVGGPIEAKIPLAVFRAGPIFKGPLVFNFDFTPYVFIALNLEATFSPTLTASSDAFFGIQWHRDSGVTLLTDLTPSGNWVADTSALTGEAEVEIGTGGRADYQLYYTVGPFVEGELYGGLRGIVNAAQPDCVSVETFLGLRVIGGGQMEILSYRAAVEATRALEFFLSSDAPRCAPDTARPGQPGAVQAVAVSNSEILLSWTEATDNVGVVNYEIWRREPGVASTAPARRIQQTTALEFNDQGLRADSQYCYYVQAVDNAGNRSPLPLNLACARTFDAIDNLPPTPPQITGAQALSTTSVQLAWTPSTDNEGISGYNIIDTTAGSGVTFPVARTSSVAGTVSRLNPGTEYCYRVVAIDRRGNLSQPSNQVCVTTRPSSSAEWTVFLGCQQREFLLEANLDFDEQINSAVEVSGAGFDYDSTPLSYSLRGIYEAASAELAADIFWAFEDSGSIRQDRFTALLATGDSGIVPMEQVQDGNRGCDAQVRIVRSNAVEVASQSVRSPRAASASPPLTLSPRAD